MVHVPPIGPEAADEVVELVAEIAERLRVEKGEDQPYGRQGQDDRERPQGQGAIDEPRGSSRHVVEVNRETRPAHPLRSQGPPAAQLLPKERPLTARPLGVSNFLYSARTRRLDFETPSQDLPTWTSEPIPTSRR
jgi:hypothetical protein